MSAIVCGSKRSLFDDLSSSAASSSSPPLSKKLRRFSSSSPPSSSLLLLHHLAALFPDMDNQILERAIEECGDDLDSAIRSLNQLRLESANKDSSEAKVLNLDGNEWVELFVREMTNASDMKDAKDRASRALQALEKSINARAGAESSLQQENSMLRQQLEALVQENGLLKRAVVTRQRETEDQSQELRQMVSQYQEQLRTLEVNNYALTLHLKQAQQNNSSIPGRYHPDVF